GGSKTAMPSGPEQLRLRLTVLQNTLIMLQLRHPGRRELEGVNFALFEKYKEYLLGDYCYGLRSSEDSGSLVPPWSLVLSYEHAIRKHAYKVMATGYRRLHLRGCARNGKGKDGKGEAQGAATAAFSVGTVSYNHGSLHKVRQSYLDRIAAKEFDLGPFAAMSAREVAALVADGAATFLAMEQPEDLGALASFGTPYAKPTRLLLHTSLPMPDCVYEGPPGAGRDGAPPKRTLELVLARVGSLEQLEKEAFRMAAGGEKGCTLASDQDLHHQLRDLWKDWLEAQDLGEPGLLDVAPGQPLHLRLLRAMLEAAGDPDREFLRQAEEGLPVGILDPLPRTPHVFEEQVKWLLENFPWEASLAWVPNYSSVEEHADFARAKFEEDVSEGLMAKMSMGEFLERYGEHTAIAALAVIVEDEELDKKRIIHEEGETAFSVVGDIAKAHRRYKHSAK
ncbi:unnamed protein product, partial [Symbiodinium necroappetens]